MTRGFNSIALALTASLQSFGSVPAPEEFLRAQMQLSPGQVTGIQNGKAFAKILPTSNPSDIFVCGAVYIHAKPAAYLQFMQDMTRRKTVTGYLGAGKFSAPPTVGDLDGLSLERDDIEDLKNCRPGDCELQLPEESMEAARAAIQWNSPDVAEQVTILAKRGIVRLLEGVSPGRRSCSPDLPRQGRSIAARGAVQVASESCRIVSPVLPDLNRYLLHYPDSRPEEAQDLFYWEKVNFGLKPTIRVNHGIMLSDFRSGTGSCACDQAALRDALFSDRARSVLCVPGFEGLRRGRILLITVKGSRQAGLTGVKGGLIRKVAVTRTRDSLERALNSIREDLEHRTGREGQRP